MLQMYYLATIYLHVQNEYDHHWHAAATVSQNLKVQSNKLHVYEYDWNIAFLSF